MKLTQKRTCSGCKSGYDGNCDLGFKTKVIKEVCSCLFYGPAEPCYKPMTNSDWLEARKDLRMTRPDNDLLHEAKRSLRPPVWRRVIRRAVNIVRWHVREFTQWNPGGYEEQRERIIRPR